MLRVFVDDHIKSRFYNCSSCCLKPRVYYLSGLYTKDIWIASFEACEPIIIERAKS